MSRFHDPKPLAAAHLLDGFECGNAELDNWLVRHAHQAARSGSARTYVVAGSDHRVVGYHALAAAAVEQNQATARAARGQPRHPVPAVLLARLAVHAQLQGHGLGAWLLRDAMTRTLAAEAFIGVRVMLVHATDETARAFYERWGFERSPSDPFNLQMLVKDIRKSLA